MMIPYLLLLFSVGPIDWQNPVQEKNFYLLSTIEKSPALQSAVRADSRLSAVAAAKRESLKQIQACSLQEQCFIQP